MNTKLNKSDFIILAIYFTVDFIIQGNDYYGRNALLREYLLDFPAELFATCTTMYLFVFWITPKIVNEKKYFLYTIFGMLIMIIVSGIEYTIGYWSGKNDWSKYPKGINFILQMLNRSVRDVSFPFALLLTKKLYEGQAQVLKIEKQQKENELKLLRSQIDPHFLFNNLNTLDSLIDTDTEKAKEYINKLSSTYRYLIKTKDSEVMELNEELTFAKNYIFLIKTRFGNDYLFNIDIINPVNDKFIPTGAIQTLLENVVKHNIPNKNSSINTFIKVEEDYLSVENQKSNQPSQKESLRTGLNNLKTRYELLSDQKVIIINTETSFSVTIPIIKLSN